MAEVYRRVRGMPVQKAIAHTQEVQEELMMRSWEIAMRAEANLVKHRQDGDAQILLMQGDIDHYVVLDDTRGMGAAMSMEFGRAGFIDPESGIIYDRMEPLFILTEAANLPKRGGGLRAPKKKSLTKRQLKKLLRKRGIEVKDDGGSTP
jgi:hypothetical protein